MSYSVKFIPNFERELKKLVKKYASLSKEYQELVRKLSVNPLEGISIGNHCYKIRLGISSKGKGKSGGARVITYVQVIGKTVYLISIFDKSDKENIPDKALFELLKQIP